MGRGARGGFMRGRPYADHFRSARRMKEHPGMWVEVGLYNSKETARSVVRHMRSGTHIGAYTPAGAFRGSIRMVDEGYIVDGMYVGRLAAQVEGETA